VISGIFIVVGLSATCEVNTGKEEKNFCLFLTIEMAIMITVIKFIISRA